jgi:hypothetical protein
MKATIEHYPKRLNPPTPSIQTPPPSSSLPQRLRKKLQRTREALKLSNAECNKLKAQLKTSRANAALSANTKASRQQDACNLFGNLLRKIEETQAQMINDIHSMKNGMNDAFAEIWDLDLGPVKDKLDVDGDEEGSDSADKMSEPDADSEYDGLEIKDEDQSVEESE